MSISVVLALVVTPLQVKQQVRYTPSQKSIFTRFFTDQCLQKQIIHSCLTLHLCDAYTCQDVLGYRQLRSKLQWPKVLQIVLPNVTRSLGLRGSKHSQFICSVIIIKRPQFSSFLPRIPLCINLASETRLPTWYQDAPVSPSNTRRQLAQRQRRASRISCPVKNEQI